MKTFKRTHAHYEGNTTVCNVWLPAQRVKICGLHDSGNDYPEEDDMWRIQTPDGQSYVVDGCDLTPHPNAPATNAERFDHLCTWESPLVQLFLVDAVCKMADAVLANPDETRRQMENSMVNAEAWLQAAQVVKEAFKN